MYLKGGHLVALQVPCPRPRNGETPSPGVVGTVQTAYCFRSKASVIVEEVASVYKHAYRQAERFEVLQTSDVEALSKVRNTNPLWGSVTDI